MLYGAKTVIPQTVYPPDHKYLGWNDDAWREGGGGFDYRRRHQKRRKNIDALERLAFDTQISIIPEEVSRGTIESS